MFVDAGVPGRSSWVHPFEPSSGSQAAVSPGISMFPGSAALPWPCLLGALFARSQAEPWERGGRHGGLVLSFALTGVTWG